MSARIADIQRVVADSYGIPLETMRSPDSVGMRQRCYARPRQVAITLATRLSRHSLVRIGQLFGGRDHTTVIYAVNAVEERCKSSPALNGLMGLLTTRLTAVDNPHLVTSDQRSAGA